MFRGTPLSFAYDALALALSQEAISFGADQHLVAVERNFISLPFMHSESLLIHEQALDLFRSNGQQGNFDCEMKHKAIIERFGRYPHRNKVLGRESTDDEVEFLQKPGSSF